MEKLYKDDMMRHFKELNSRLNAINKDGEVFVILDVDDFFDL